MTANAEGRPRADWPIFLLHWLKSPLRIGAALPTGPRVARALARQMQLDRPGPILELGAGTGGITRGLIEGGCPPERLILVESEQGLADHLKLRHPNAQVLCGDARGIGHLLDTLGIDRLATVISSLPIKWFSTEDQRAVVMPCLKRLGPGGWFVQITNGMVSPIADRALRINAAEIERIWVHFLPVQIWRYWLD